MEKQRITVDQHSGVGLLWIAAWLFSIGYLDLSFWRGVIALLIWPYYMGADLAAPIPVVPVSQ